MFALALWDAPRERLVLARDRLGKKPLVWTRLADGTLAFASELKALLSAAAVRREPDLAALDAYLALSTCPARYGLLGDRAAAAGPRPRRRGRSRADRALLDAGGRAAPSASEAEWLERVRETVGAAVRRAARRGRAARRAALRRDRLLDRRRADGAGERRAGAHVHGRVRGRALRRARLRARGRRALRDDARGDRARAGRRGDAAAARRGVRRAARRRGGAPALPRLRGGAAATSRSR